MIRSLLARLALAFALLAAAPAQAQALPQAQTQPPAVTAFVRVNVVPMDRDRVLRNQTVIVRDGRVAAIGAGLPVPEGAQVIDGRGTAWLSPGLADMHVHSDTRHDMAVYLANGVTTVLNMGDARNGFVVRTGPASSRGDIPGPRVFLAFVVDGGPNFGHLMVRDADQARAAVTLAKANGYSFIKVYNDLSPEVFAVLAEEGRRQGVPLVGHGLTRLGLARQLDAGQVLVAHAEEFFYTVFTPIGAEQTDAVPNDARIAEAVALMRAHPGAAVGADLVTYGAIAGQIGRPDVVAAILAAPEMATLSPADRMAWRASNYVTKTADLSGRRAFLDRLIKALAEADVPLLAGTDAATIPGVFPGKSLHDDLDLLERAGLSRFQALSAATRTPGEFMVRTTGAEPFGVVAEGVRADLVLTSASPLDDLSTLRRPLGVMAGGRWRDAPALAGLLETVARTYREAALP